MSVGLKITSVSKRLTQTCCTALLLLPAFNLAAQSSYIFSHLTTANGLSANNVRMAVTDQNGYLWVATSEGLNWFDGYTVTVFPKDKYPALPSDNLDCLLCDRKNRIWVGARTGLAMFDENRNLKKIKPGGEENFPVAQIIETSATGILVVGWQADYALIDPEHPLDSAAWKKLGWAAKYFHAPNFHDLLYIGNGQFLFEADDKVCVFDYTTGKEILRMDLPFAWSGCRINTNELLIASQQGSLFRVSIPGKKIIKTYLLAENPGENILNSSIAKIRPVSDTEVFIATQFRGLYVFNWKRESFRSYRHDPLDNNSISEDRTENIFSDPGGDIFVITGHAGLNILNNRSYKINYRPAFPDDKGKIFDGYINDIAVDSRQRVWLAAFDRIIRWDQKNNTARFFQYYTNVAGLGNRAMEIKSILLDPMDRVWASAYGAGVLLLDENTGKFRPLTSLDSTAAGNPLRSIFIHDLVAGPDGKIWCCSGLGVFSIDPLNYRIDTFLNHPLLKALNGKRVIKIFRDHLDRLWFASPQYGAFVYDSRKETLKNYSENDGLPSNNCICFSEDPLGTIYIGTGEGLFLLSANGERKIYNRTNGLKSNSCTGLLSDRDGNIWVSNNNILVRYSPRDQAFQYFGNESGFPDCGFIANACFRDGSQDFFWGTQKGLTSFRPSSLSISTGLRLSISKLVLPDSVVQLTRSTAISLKPWQNSLNFGFSAVELNGSRNILYQYRLLGYETQWNPGTDITQARYGRLPAGKYTFQLKASKDGTHWVDSKNEVQVRIAAPFWKKAWFVAALIVVGAALVYYINRLAGKRRKEKETLRINYEKKIAAVEMNALRAQMNPHFIFNSLNSINTFILKNDQENATDYLQKFSSLVRLILDNSRNEWILLENELKALELYIDLEKVRFENIFSSRITVSPDVKISSVWVPPLIIQPYAENAIRHGLIHRKEPGGNLSINVWKENGELFVQVEDNGIGRKASEKMKRTINKLHQPSHGMKITAERLSIVNDVYKVNARVRVSDLENPNGENKGTSVLLTIQYRNYEGNNN